ncbi:MAG: PKD domain-containing protein [Ginsengibacter sp.]
MKPILKFSTCIFILGIIFISCQKKFLCPDCEINKPPIANAGPDQTIILPKDSVMLDGSNSSDADGKIVSYKWAMISGPFLSNFTKNDSVKTLVKGLVIGVYQFELNVTDDKGASAKDIVQITVNVGNGVNQPPVANAGIDEIVTLPVDSVLLNGSFSIDPDGTIVSYQWTKISGPSSSNILNSQAPQTMVKNLTKGVYQFELKVTDNLGAIGKDTMQITVNDASQINRPPVACAGADQVVTLPTNTVNLTGSCSTDPDNNITNYAWTNISGPSGFTISNANAVQTQVTNLVQGVYLFELKVTDTGGLFSKDTMQLTVSPAVASVDCNGNIRPFINAQLIPIGTLSEPQSFVSIATAGNKIFFCGGYKQNHIYSTRVDIYDITNNAWSSAELSQAREGITSVALGNKIFFAGGYFGGNGPGNSSRVDIYDLQTNKWTTAQLSTGRQLIAAAAAGDKVLFAGGFGWGAGYYTIVDIYDASTDKWSTTSLSDRGRDAGVGIASVVLDNKIYFAGSSGDWPGYDFGDLSSTINIYDAITNTWAASKLRGARGFLAGIAINDKIYWAGGDTYPDDQPPGEIYTNEVEIWDKKTNNSSFCTLFQPNAYFSSAQKDNKIIFFTGDGASKNRFDIYDVLTQKWSIGMLPVNITAASVISVNNTIYVAGGLVNGSFSNQVWKLEF